MTFNKLSYSKPGLVNLHEQDVLGSCADGTGFLGNTCGGGVGADLSCSAGFNFGGIACDQDGSSAPGYCGMGGVV